MLPWHISRLLISAVLIHAALFSQSTAPGSFVTIGYGARAIGMGNALTSLGGKRANSAYNPALAATAVERDVSLSAGILSLDRSLDWVSFTQPLKPTAGLTLGILHAGVSNIDGRDADGVHTEDYSTSENQFSFTFANRFSDRLALGLTLKLYYVKLFQDLSSTTAGFDLGATYAVNDDLTVGVAILDINSKYKWDSSKLYGSSGASTIDKLATRTRIGASYCLPNGIGRAAADVEYASTGRTVLRVGSEISVADGISVRCGIDRVSLREKMLAIPSLGFGVEPSIASLLVAVDYAFVFEPYSSGNMHVITLSVRP